LASLETVGYGSVIAPDILFAIIVALRIVDAFLGRSSQPDERQYDGSDASDHDVELMRHSQLLECQTDPMRSSVSASSWPTRDLDTRSRTPGSSPTPHVPQGADDDRLASPELAIAEMYLADRAEAVMAPPVFRSVRFEINGDNCSVDICSAGWQSVHYVTV
jgi:hypothetical protein